jgi:hypothetical protein
LESSLLFTIDCHVGRNIFARPSRFVVSKTSQQYNDVRRQICRCVGIEDVVGDTLVPAEHLNDAKLVSEVITRYEPYGYFVAMHLMLLI